MAEASAEPNDITIEVVHNAQLAQLEAQTCPLGKRRIAPGTVSAKHLAVSATHLM
jgi:hypothetical protein